MYSLYETLEQYGDRINSTPPEEMENIYSNIIYSQENDEDFTE